VEILTLAFFAVSIWLSFYTANALFISIIFLYNRFSGKTKSGRRDMRIDSWPDVTVQLPVYNEPHVIRRLIDSVANLDYPAERLTIQVLDDSTDETTSIAAERVGYWQSRGIRMFHYRRNDRSEYKAGNLKFGMSKTESEFIAIFDADFVVPTDWLKCALTPFFEPDGQRVGLVQTRWIHLNESHSPLTRAQALLMDGDFGVDKQVRSDQGLFLRFNGAAGIWRRRCIEETGGWNGEVLSEDLDLSYRAQLAGWRFKYVMSVGAMAELPVTMSAFRIQQARWACGSMQVFRRVFSQIVFARISLWKKWQALIHLTGYLIYPLIILMVLLSLPLAFGDTMKQLQIPMLIVGVAGVGAPIFFALGEWNLYPQQAWWKRFAWFPFLSMLWIGIAVSLTQSVVVGLLNVRSPFHRTPKTGAQDNGARPVKSHRRYVKVNVNTLLEIVFCLYALLVVVIDIQYGNWMGAAILGLYAIGFAWVASAGIWESLSPVLHRLGKTKPLNLRVE
jgi:cellulose synthase/poly-beta-1,6-N-acetylglucosamine synthase-like glycosyltransferase